MKQDGWALHNGVKTNKKHPKTFYIPTEKQRTTLKASDLAKLGFDIRHRHVKWGSPVVFLPEHVIDIVPAKAAVPRKRKR
ncbi:hypothetical protein ACH79_10950 [Bradyrhizobium sp. CCBAU 051011]|nr:hypothetical protein ACH79_10950 [Bradyrhizobium sp. CCBAU 051011]